MAEKLRVVVFGPPLNNSGGVGTLFTYFRDEVEGLIDLKFVDTRGSSRHPIFSIFSLLSSICQATILKIQRRIDVAHLNMGSRGSSFRKLTLAFWLKRILGVPTALHLHASSFDTWIETSNPLVKKIVISGINRADKLFVLGEIWKDKMVSFGVDADLIQILVMGVPDLSSSELRHQKNDQVIRVLFAGEMSERKGLPSLLDAMSDERLSDYHLSVAGSGSVDRWKTYLESKPAQRRTDFLGHITVDEVHRELAQSQILILPSRAEGLPVSVMEGFAASTTVICTVVGALETYLEDDQNSIVLKSSQPSEIASALLRAANADIRSKLSVNGHSSWNKHFNVRNTSGELMSIWRSLHNTKTQ